MNTKLITGLVDLILHVILSDMYSDLQYANAQVSRVHSRE